MVILLPLICVLFKVIVGVGVGVGLGVVVDVDVVVVVDTGQPPEA